MLDGDGIDNLLELSVRLNKSTLFSKQYEKYQVLHEDQDQRVNNNHETDQSTADTGTSRLERFNKEK